MNGTKILKSSTENLRSNVLIHRSFLRSINPHGSCHHRVTPTWTSSRCNTKTEFLTISDRAWTHVLSWRNVLGFREIPQMGLTGTSKQFWYPCILHCLYRSRCTLALPFVVQITHLRSTSSQDGIFWVLTFLYPNSLHASISLENFPGFRY